ncbi:MAG TPA: radical SAM protein [Candidatus Polarisedimenticolia bacterium]|nr:radical SAM protein [Candidatus Polarisedimenticolia bacterium]
MARTPRPSVVLVEPDINPITRRFGLPIVANYPPLAQARLAGQLEPVADVAIADLRIPGERERLAARLRADPPSLVGVSVTFTSNGDEAIEAMEAIRRAAPGVPIVLGGTAPSEDPASFFDSRADWIGHRRGDASLPALVEHLAREGTLPGSFPGFFHREGGSWVLTPGADPPELSRLRPCAWHRIPARSWRRYFQGLRPTGIGQTSEGCPFDCTFCSVWTIHGRKVTLASLDNVQHDFRSLPPFVRGFFFADDIWMQAGERQIRDLYDPLLEWMAGEFLPRRGDFWLTVETRTDLYLRQEERFRAWIRSGGLRWILFGVEAVTDEQLREFSKRNTVDANALAIRRAAEEGAYVTAQFVIPCEADVAYFDEIVRFLREHRRWLRAANFTIATPLPGTELYKTMLQALPELADRKAVSHPAFSLFTALTPMRMEAPAFYEQVARVYSEANQARFRPEIVRQGWRTLWRSPWLIPRLTRIPAALRALTDPATFLDVHRQVQGARLLAGSGAPAGGPAAVAAS